MNRLVLSLMWALGMLGVVSFVALISTALLACVHTMYPQFLPSARLFAGLAVMGAMNAAFYLTVQRGDGGDR